MSRLSIQITVQSYFLLVYLLFESSSISGVGSLKTKCMDEERRALLKFKDSLRTYDHIEHPLSSWGSEHDKKECCSWSGIRCDNITDHVISLDLHRKPLSVSGEHINPPLMELQYLNYLDLTGIYSFEIDLSSLIGNNMVSLQHLDLTETEFLGPIPENFGYNMTALSHLILNSNGLEGPIPEAFCNMPSLTYLDLGMNFFDGSIPKCLGNLTLLKHIDLSSNHLEGSIPETFGRFTLTYLNLSSNFLDGSIKKPLTNMSHLKFLDLRDNYFNGSIPEDFGNLASLTYLDLGMNYLKGSIPITFESMSSTLTHLALGSNELEGLIPNTFGKNGISLSHLDLSKNKLEGTIPQFFCTHLTFLLYLDLSHNKLQGSIPECFSNNMTMLTHLGLANNSLEGPIPDAFGNMMSKLEHLDIGFNQLSGEIPKPIWKICSLREMIMHSNNLSGNLPELTQSSSTCTSHSLEVLDLGDNQITGLFPSLRLFSSLRTLNLSSNQIHGSLDPSIGQLSKLEFLNVSYNLLEGAIFEAHFLELSKLRHLDLSSNKLLLFKVSSTWVPPFNLEKICLSSCKLGPKFPKWLQTQNHCKRLDISNTGISDSIPIWFWFPLVVSESVNVSHNQLRGTIVNFSSLSFISVGSMDLSSNQFEGAVPEFLFKVTSVLHLSRNNFSSINAICNIEKDYASLKVFDASHNQLSGKLPDCWHPFEDLEILNLAENYELSGEIPTSIGSLTSISSLHLTGNKFIGRLPLSLKQCEDLVVLDVGDNKLSGVIPTWIGKHLRNLAILSLRSNNFNGIIPSSLCHLSHLQLLDLSGNNISGSIPNCVCNLTSMRSSSAAANASTSLEHFFMILNPSDESTDPATYADQIQVIWKGILSRYGNTLALVKMIDLSSNMLRGKIPAEITVLHGLVSFNLSANNLSGQIPLDIGNFKSLDFLDLSNNRFSGQIPPSLALINRLSVLDLSNNNLSGKIPTSTQLQSFSADSYKGNVGLCGAPLPKCEEDQEEPIGPPSSTEEGEEEEYMTHGFYVSMGVGYAVGFCGVFGTLIFNNSWRFAYFKALNDFTNWIYVMVAVSKAKLLRSLHG